MDWSHIPGSVRTITSSSSRLSLPLYKDASRDVKFSKTDRFDIWDKILLMLQLLNDYCLLNFINGSNSLFTDIAFYSRFFQI